VTWLHSNEEHYSALWLWLEQTLKRLELHVFPINRKTRHLLQSKFHLHPLLMRFTTSSAEYKWGSTGDIILKATCICIYLSDEYINFINLWSPQNPDWHSTSIQTLTSHILRIAAVMFLRPKNGGITGLITAANRLLSPHSYSINKSIKQPLEALCCGHAKTQQWAQRVWINEGFWQDVAVILGHWAGITCSIFFNFIND